MNNFRRPGSPVKRVAPVGGATSGVPLMIGGLLLVPISTVLVGEEFEAEVEGVFLLPKTSAQAWTADQKLYFNTSTKKIDSDSTTGPLVGVADAVAANPSSYGRVRLNGSASGSAEGPQAAVTALVDSGGGTADGTVAAMTIPADITGGESPTEAEHNAVLAQLRLMKDNFKELTTQVELLRARMEAYGVIAAA